MKKLMFIVSEYGVNGACKVANDLMNNLSRERYSISLLAVTINKENFPLNDDIKIINLDISPTRGINKIRNIINMLLKIRKSISIEKPDVVLSFGDTINCMVLLATIFCNVKIIITEHSEKFYR